jgi:hypothetical protein
MYTFLSFVFVFLLFIVVNNIEKSIAIFFSNC